MRAMSWAVLLGVFWAAAAAGLQPAHAADANGFEWCDITTPGNAAYPGNRFGVNAGRGSVGYSYRMAKTEVTTGQMLEFYNTFATQSDALYQVMRSNIIGWPTVTDPTYPLSAPGSRDILSPDVPNAGRVAVKGMTWRIAAIYCNWLHHDKSSDWNTIQTGAYDARTFGYKSDGTPTDQRTRSPGAKYWIPSLDEWLKSAFYDPKKDGVGGWWNQPNGSNTPLIPGFPGVGQTSATVGLMDPVWIPVGSYPDVKTPWGLLDVSGSAAEWTEEFGGFFGRDRLLGGSVEGDPDLRYDDPGEQRSNCPNCFAGGLRIASIPTPGTIWVVAVAAGLLRVRRRAARGASTP